MPQAKDVSIHHVRAVSGRAASSRHREGDASVGAAQCLYVRRQSAGDEARYQAGRGRNVERPRRWRANAEPQGEAAPSKFKLGHTIAWKKAIVELNAEDRISFF